jgi:dolichyl-phosphate-mannose-protein mannosyltransferase/protein-O-mannosyltransferase-like protein
LTRRAPRDAAGGIVALLILGLAFRAIIAYLLPGSGFKVDIDSFSYWASNLASQGLGGFYDRPFFHDYTPGYLYVLWIGGIVGAIIGGPVTLFGTTFTLVDLLKVAPILGDVALAYVVWSMARELGASERVARIGAFLVVINPVTWFDSVLWGQVDSVGVVVLLLALRELWRDRPERAAVLAMLAALIKPQLGILIPIVAVVTIRRALWPDGGYGSDDPATVTAGGTDWERRVRGPIRILTTAIAGFATAVVVSLPFGLSMPNLIAQIFKTAAGYPYLSVNAYNPWALVSQDGNGVAANRSWVCDSTVVPSGPVDLRIGDWVIYQSPGSTLTCPNGFMVGAIPAAVVGMGLFLIVAAVIVWLVARRPDRRTMLVGLAALAFAFFILPTRVHERYLFPIVGIGAVLAVASIRWRLAYVVASGAMLANMYAVLTTLYPDNPGISDWLGIGKELTSFEGVAVAAVAQAVVFAWVFSQLRDDPLDELDAAFAGSEPAPPGAAYATPGAGHAGLAPRAPIAASVMASGAGTPAVAPVWDDRDSTGSGPWAWVRARFRDRPVRADRSAALDREPGGRLDRLDLWIVLVLIASLASVRVWRLAEPYDMHFDEVYHPRTAMEFLQYWRYGISHDIYEWTHPHLAKYSMAVGIMAFGSDATEATSDIGLAGIRDATTEPRWDDPSHSRAGDRLWVVGTDEVRAYDLATRALVASWPVKGASAVGVDVSGHRVFVGTDDGTILTIDTTILDGLRATNAPVTPAGAGGSDAPAPTVEPLAWATVGAPIRLIHATGDGAAVEVVALDPSSDLGSGAELLISLDGASTAETGRSTVAGVSQIADHGDGTVAVAEAKAVVFIDTSKGSIRATVALDGAVGGLTSTSGLAQDPVYASYLASDGPKLASIKAGTGVGDAQILAKFALPGDAAGPVYFDAASRMVHAVGTTPAAADGTGAGSPTVYVINPNGSPASNAVYADARLPFEAAAIVLDDNPEYAASDRQQLLAFSSAGQLAEVPIGRHAFSWRLPGVIAGILMGALIYLLARLLFRRREVAVILAFLLVADGMLFVQSRIGMNDSYVGLGIVAAYTLFAWLWLRPGDSKRHWLAFAIGMPVIGLTLGLALASKWVAAYAIGGLGILVLGRSALGRLILILGMIVVSTVLGYLAISVPEGSAGGNYLFLAIMVGLTLAAVVATILHPIAWTWEEQRLAIWGPIAAGGVVLLGALATGRLDHRYHLGPVAVSPLEAGFLLLVLGFATYSVLVVAGRLGFGPMAMPPEPDDPASLLDAPSPAPRGWLNLGAGFGIPALFTLACLVGLPIVVYVISYIPWAWVEGHQLWPGWPPGHTGQTLVDLTSSMYSYHNNLTSPHPATSPWWAWPLDLKPVWFYQEGFAGGTTASIYDAGNIVSWWLAIPAMGFAAWQAFRRHSVGLSLLVVGFACQWIAWARIDRAAFQYHYYTALPFLLAALAYFIAELWHGPSWRTWVLARLAAAAAILGPFLLWLLQRPLCAVARVQDINPGSSACPTTIPDLALSPRTIAIAVVVGLGVLLILRVFLSSSDVADDDGVDTGDDFVARLVRAAAIGVAVTIGFALVSALLPATSVLKLKAVPVEPLALVVTIALLPVAAFVATARDARRLAAGMLVAIGLWFVVWYPNISALPLPSGFANAYQGLLPTYLYPFQFWVNTTPRGASPPLLALGPAALLVAIAVIAGAVAYSTWTWRLALAERRAEQAGWTGEEGAASSP